MRHAYLVTYDIRDPKRLRRVFKAMKGQGEHVQLSVFLCELDRTEIAKLRQKLSSILHHREDQVLFANLGPAEARGANSITALGRPYVPPDRGPIVV